MLKLSIKFSLIHVQWVLWLTWYLFSELTQRKNNNGWLRTQRRFKYHRSININFKGAGIFDLKRTQIYTHTFAWSEVIDKIEFWSCLYCEESMCITCGSEQDTVYKIIYAKMCIWCKTMCLIPYSLLAIFHV
jgi:hypothetical protein